MSEATTHDLVQRVKALLQPGEIDLSAIIIHTDWTRDDELDMHQDTVSIGDIVASHAGVEDWYVYSGNDSPDFGANQHQGLAIEDDGFVWECQQLLRDGTFDIVMYYESVDQQADLVTDLEDAGYGVTSVELTKT